MEKGSVNNEKLIREVHKHRSLWDQKSLDYLSRTLKAKEWEAVAQDMDGTVEEVKSRWKILKDSFNREVRNMAKNGNSCSKWAYFDSMSFLLKGSNSLLLPSAYLSQSMIELNSPNTSSASYYNELSENSLHSPEEDTESISSRKRIKVTNSTMLNNGTDSMNSSGYQTNSSVEYTGFRTEQSSEDYYFLMSLLPSFERMSPQQKMLVRIKMMQDVYEAAYGEMSSDYSHNRSGMDNCSNTVSSGS
ncbi:uncharacterized protein CDAR_102341 [Caerostris darwini]|uniref:MADF domain-containing protein n=1 Tax=Caerostris darwini TaxID=1538125 RepID=A0AAV4TU00_9ARAC|nr:uncharacterized protein CDAR_102341 [Caerostris darwini]